MKRKMMMILMMFGVSIGLMSASVRAATYTVTNTGDSGGGSLRQAVLDANAAAGDDIIEFDAALSSATITLASEIEINNNGALSINGLGAMRLIVDGGAGDNRIFLVSGATVTIRGLTLQNGGSFAASVDGSAIYAVNATTTLDAVLVQNNRNGTGVGSLYFAGGSARILNSTIAGNTADACAGFLANLAIVSVANTTITRNAAQRSNGGGFCTIFLTVTVRNSTITENTAGDDGGGIYVISGAVNLGNTIVAGNISYFNPDISGSALQSVGGNLIGSNSGVETQFPNGTPNANGDFVNVYAYLLPLGNYGGNVPTRALAADSLAHNNGNNANAVDPFDNSALAYDARGVGFARKAGTVDIGAFEVQCDNTPPTITPIGVSRAKGSPVSNSQIATVNDVEDAEDTLAVKVNGASSATAGGVTVSGIVVDSSGSVTADVVATCGATNASFTLRVTDSEGEFSEATLGVTVTPDNITPVINLSSTVITLYPANHQYRTIQVSQLVASVSDNCSTLTVSDVRIAQVTSDEVDNAPGNSDGNTVNDIVIAGDCKSVQLRAERDGNRNGRVYTVTLRLRDAAGNTTTATRQITVPLSQNSTPAIDDGAAYTVISSCP